MTTWDERRAQMRTLRDQLTALPPGTTVHQQYSNDAIIPTSAIALAEDLHDAIASGAILHDAMTELREHLERRLT